MSASATTPAAGYPAASLPIWFRGKKRPFSALEICFYLFIVCIPFETVGADLTNSLFSITKLVGYVLFSLAMFRSNKSLRKSHWVFWCFLLYLAVFCTMAVLQDPAYQQASVMRLLQLVQFLIFFRISFNLMQDDRVLDGTIVVLALTSAVVVGLSITGVGVSIDNDDLGNRYSMFAENVNTFAANISFGMLAALGVAYERPHLPPKIRFTAWGILLFLCFAIVRTASRGAVVSLVVALLCFLIRRESVLRKVGTVVIAILAIAAVGFLSYTFSTGRNRWAATIVENKTSQRDQLIPKAWEMFLERPYFGWGPTENIAVFGSRVGSAGSRDTHNLYLWVLTETGLFGGLPYIAALFLALGCAWRARGGPQHILPFAMMVFLLTYNMADSWFNRKLFWVVLAYACASESQVRRQKRTRIALLEAPAGGWTAQ